MCTFPHSLLPFSRCNAWELYEGRTTLSSYVFPTSSSFLPLHLLPTALFCSCCKRQECWMGRLSCPLTLLSCFFSFFCLPACLPACLPSPPLLFSSLSFHFSPPRAQITIAAEQTYHTAPDLRSTTILSILSKHTITHFFALFVCPTNQSNSYTLHYITS